MAIAHLKRSRIPIAHPPMKSVKDAREKLKAVNFKIIPKNDRKMCDKLLDLWEKLEEKRL